MDRHVTGGNSLCCPPQAVIEHLRQREQELQGSKQAQQAQRHNSQTGQLYVQLATPVQANEPGERQQLHGGVSARLSAAVPVTCWFIDQRVDSMFIRGLPSRQLQQLLRLWRIHGVQRLNDNCLIIVLSCQQCSSLDPMWAIRAFIGGCCISRGTFSTRTVTSRHHSCSCSEHVAPGGAQRAGSGRCCVTHLALCEWLALHPLDHPLLAVICSLMNNCVASHA